VKFYADYIPMLDVLRGHKLSLHHSPEWMVKALMYRKTIYFVA